MSNEIIEFGVRGIIRQKVTIVAKDVTGDLLVERLESGHYGTTVMHDGVETFATNIVCNETGMIIARINEQRLIGDAGHDYEIDGFELVTEELEEETEGE